MRSATAGCGRRRNLLLQALEEAVRLLHRDPVPPRAQAEEVVQRRKHLPAPARERRRSIMLIKAMRSSMSRCGRSRVARMLAAPSTYTAPAPVLLRES